MIRVPTIQHERDPNQRCGYSDMYEIARDWLDSQLVRYPFETSSGTIESWEELVARGIIHDEDTGRDEPTKLVVELRKCGMRFAESGVVGNCTMRSFAHQVRYAYMYALEDLRREQPGCQWELVAASVERINIAVTVPEPYQGPKTTMANIALWGSSDVAVAIDQRQTQVQRPDYVCQLTAVFADMARGPIIDPQAVALDGFEGNMTKYAKTRNVHHLSTGARAHREECEAFIRKFYSAAAPAPAPPPPRPSPQVAPAPTPTADDQLAEIVQRRKAGESPRVIAKAMGLLESRVKDILRTAGT